MKGSSLRQEKARRCKSLRREDRSRDPNTNACGVGQNSPVGQFFFPITPLQASWKSGVLALVSI